MANFRRKTSRRVSSKGHKRSRFELEEFGPGKGAITMCQMCNAVYYQKSWHHNLEDYKELSSKKNISFELCPACAMWKRHVWEGEIRISGAIPTDKKKQMKNTILSIADEAYKRDPMHRIFDIKEKGKEIIVYSSENQLANRIAHKLADSFKTHFSKPVFHHGKRSGDLFLLTMEWIS